MHKELFQQTLNCRRRDLCNGHCSVSVRLRTLGSHEQEFGRCSQDEPRSGFRFEQATIDSENSKDFDAVKAMVWESPSALFVAKTATAAEGNWAAFWGHDVVVEHLHDVIYGGPFHMNADYTKAKAVLLSADVADTYVPVQITVGYGGSRPCQSHF